jgi:hypothetical protein
MQSPIFWDISPFRWKSTDVSEVHVASIFSVLRVNQSRNHHEGGSNLCLPQRTSRGNIPEDRTLVIYWYLSDVQYMLRFNALPVLSCKSALAVRYHVTILVSVAVHTIQKNHLEIKSWIYTDSSDLLNTWTSQPSQLSSSCFWTWFSSIEPDDSILTT